MNLRTFAMTILLSVSAMADEITISGPTMGLVYTGGAFRPVLGFPGAAYVGGVLALDFTPDNVMIAPEQSFALAMSAGKLVLIDASKGKLVVRDVPGITDAANAWFSPAGKSAVLISTDGLHARLLTGLPGHPGVSAQFVLNDIAVIAAVSEDARFAITVSSTGVVSQWDGDGHLRGAVPMGDVVALQFYNRSGDALLASRSNKQLFKLRESGDVVPIQAIDAIAVATSADDSILVAVSSDGSIQTLRENGESTGTYTSPIAATRLQRMGGILRLNDYGKGPLAVFDGSQAMLIPPAKDGGDQ